MSNQAVHLKCWMYMGLYLFDVDDSQNEYEPGPDGKLISTDERLQAVRQPVQEEVAQQGENTHPPLLLYTTGMRKNS